MFRPVFPSAGAEGAGAVASAATEAAARLVFDLSPDCVKLVDADECVAWINAQGCRLLEVPDADAILGRPWASLWPEAARGRLHQAVEDARRGGTGRFTGYCPTFGGTPKWWDVLVMALPSSSNRGDYLLSISRDVTAVVVALEREREAAAMAECAREEAEAAREGKERLLAAVSHELRSPLQAVLGWAVLLQGEAADSRPAEIGRRVESLALDQIALVDALLQEHKPGQLRSDSAVIALEDVARDTAEAMRPLIESSGRTIACAASVALPAVIGDIRRLRQVFASLLSNAVKYTAAGGHIDLSCHSRDGHACVEVRDDGCGVPETMHEQIFEPYFQADPATSPGGIGLGLYLARGIVEQHGGTLSVSADHEGQGSTFVVRIPFASSAAPAADARCRLLRSFDVAVQSLGEETAARRSATVDDAKHRGG